MYDKHIGRLEGISQSVVEATETIEQTFLSKTKWKSAKLIAISEISHDTRVYRFALQAPEQHLGLLTGQHVFARLRRKIQNGHVVGEMVQRAYTPVSNKTVKGFVELLVKYVLFA